MKNYPHRKSHRKPIGNNKVQLFLLKPICETSKPASSWMDSEEGDARDTCSSLRTAGQTLQWLQVNKAVLPVLLHISTFSRYLYLPKIPYPDGQCWDIHLAYFFSMIPFIAQISEFFQIINIPSFPWFINPPIFLSSRVTETKEMVSRGDGGGGWVKSREENTVKNIVISLRGDRWSLALV